MGSRQDVCSPERNKDMLGDNYKYALLARMQSDCRYVLDVEIGIYGNSLRACQFRLWAKTPEAQIAHMRKLYDEVPEKPDWITEEEISGYEKHFKEISSRECRPAM